ncbi:MAG: hypothetical protein MHM6MM_004572 [Cercozoa sp. M6MM]
MDSLELQAVVGFNGNPPNGLILHPNEKEFIYPLGSSIVIRPILGDGQRFLSDGGHKHEITTLALSKSGRFLATGERAPMLGMQAAVIVWDLENDQILHNLSLHNAKIRCCAFTHNERFLITMGGFDDNKVVVWDLETGEPVCGASAGKDAGLCLQAFHNTDTQFVTAGKYHARLWTIDLENHKLRPADFSAGILRRVITSVALSEDDVWLFCGTTSGDVLKIDVKNRVLKHTGPAGSQRLGQGVTAVALPRERTVKVRVRGQRKRTENTTVGEVVVGSGDGTVAVLRTDDLRVVRKHTFDEYITSLVLNKAHDHFFVGTRRGSIYLTELATLDNEMRASGHFRKVQDVCFAHGSNGIFLTCSSNDIRVWNCKNASELLRISVSETECNAIALTKSGNAILSGWTDGCIRAFAPQSGRMLFEIRDAHSQFHGGVTALKISSDDDKIISGGGDGTLRVWALKSPHHELLVNFKEHKASVAAIAMTKDDSEITSVSHDGSAIVWDMTRSRRRTAMFANTQFSAVVYHPDESQLVTTGTDRQLTFWDAVDADEIRILEGSPVGTTIHALGISSDGSILVSAGSDKCIKVWLYDAGIPISVGRGHSGAVTAVAISPDNSKLVSVGEEGGIFIWDLPTRETIHEKEEAENAAWTTEEAMKGEQRPLGAALETSENVEEVPDSAATKAEENRAAVGEASARQSGCQ